MDVREEHRMNVVTICLNPDLDFCDKMKKASEVKRE